MDYGQACRQTFIYQITEGLPVIREWRDRFSQARYQSDQLSSKSRLR